MYGVKTPGVLKTPSRISCVAMPEGKPTVDAIAEWPIGFPYISRVEVRISYNEISPASSIRKSRIMNLPAVFPLNMKFMLQHDKVSLPLIVHQQRLELSTQGVQEISIPGHYCVAGEKTDPFQARNDATRLFFARKLVSSLDAGDEATEGCIIYLMSITVLR